MLSYTKGLALADSVGERHLKVRICLKVVGEYLTKMSIKKKRFFTWVLCLSHVVVWTACQVTLVYRNVTDSFRIGKDGCTNNVSICPTSSTCDQQSVLCLCSASEKTFRNPTIEIGGGNFMYGDAYGCVDGPVIRRGVGTIECQFSPFQVIPYRENDLGTIFKHDIRDSSTNSKALLNSCSLTKATIKFPDNFTEFHIQWLNDSYFDFTIISNEIHFKWNRSVAVLQGAIITLQLKCFYPVQKDINTCLRAKILGTWRADAMESFPTSTQSTKFPMTEKTNSFAHPSISFTAKNKTATITRSNENCSDSNILKKVIFPLLAISLFANIILGLAVIFWWKKIHRNQKENLQTTEMQSNDNQGRLNSRDELALQYEVVVRRGVHRPIEKIALSSVGNNSKKSSSDDYEESANYEPLRRNQNAQNDQHNYQTLTRS